MAQKRADLDGGTRRHPRPTQSSHLRLHHHLGLSAARQRRALYRGAPPRHFRGRPCARRGFPRPAGRVLRQFDRAALHDACDGAARGRVRPPWRRQRQFRGAVFDRDHDVGDAVLVDAQIARLRQRSPCSTAASTSGRRKAAPWRAGPAKGYPAATFNAKPRAGYFVDKQEVLAATGERDTIVVNALNDNCTRGSSRAATAGRAAFPEAAMSRRRRWSIPRPKRSCRSRTPRQNSQPKDFPRQARGGLLRRRHLGDHRPLHAAPARLRQADAV